VCAIRRPRRCSPPPTSPAARCRSAVAAAPTVVEALPATLYRQLLADGVRVAARARCSPELCSRGGRSGAGAAASSWPQWLPGTTARELPSHYPTTPHALPPSENAPQSMPSTACEYRCQLSFLDGSDRTDARVESEVCSSFMRCGGEPAGGAPRRAWAAVAGTLDLRPGSPGGLHVITRAHHCGRPART
jgi:hypothetical protein